MNNKFLRVFAIILSVFLFLIVIGNFALNYWLKNNLPAYIKENTAYKITYQNLDVELLSGNIVAQGITVNNLQPTDSKKLGLQGTVDSLVVSRFGIYDALVNKEINSNNVSLSKPVLNITLPEKKKKNGKEKKPIAFDNLKIRNGNIQIFKSNKRKLLSVTDLNVKIAGLELNTDDPETNLPLGFDSYSIEANKVFFRPDNIYLITANHLKTVDGQLIVDQFSLLPLLSYKQFVKYYPAKGSLLNIQTQKLALKNFTLKDKKISLEDILLETPNVKMYTSGAKSSKEKKPFQYDLKVDNLAMKNAIINIIKPDQSPLFTAQNLSFKMDKILMNAETKKEKIPFKYNTFTINGKNLSYFTGNEQVDLASVKIDPKMAVLNSINLKTTQSAADKNTFDLQTKSIVVKIKEWVIENSKLNLEINEVLINQIQGKMATAEQKTTGKTAKKESFLNFPLKIHKININNSNINLSSKGKPMALNGLNLTVNDFELNENSAQQTLLKSASYNFTLNNFKYQPSQFYELSANNIKVTQTGGNIANFAMKPLVTRAQYVRMLKTEKDLYDLKAQRISFTGNYDLLNQNKYLDLSNVTLNSVNANIFRSKIPADDKTVKPLYSRMLRSIKFPLFVSNLDIKNSVLVYEEDIPTSDGPGKLVFNPFALNVKNVNSAKMKGKPTQVDITIKSKFMAASQLDIKWGFNTADTQDRFKISGTVGAMSAAQLNPFVEPYLNVTATGLIKKLTFDFYGNPAGINGTFKMQHDNLKIKILKKNSNKVNTLLSGIVNLIIKNSSDKYPESVNIDGVERDNTKSFFNLLWKGMQEGLTKSLLGIDYKKTTKAVKNTVEGAKETVSDVKSSIKDAATDVKQTVKEVKKDLKSDNKEPEKKEKEGFFKRIFK